MFRCWIALLMLTGHGAIWVGVFNRINARDARWIGAIEKASMLCLAAPFLWLGWGWWTGALSIVFYNPPNWLLAYGWLGVCILASKVPSWLRERCQRQFCPALLKHHVQQIDIAKHVTQPANGVGRLWRLIPQNETWQLSVERKTLYVPNMPSRLSGFSITHLSDFHFTGLVSREYFEIVVERANAFDSDLVAITGDIIDRHECMPWLESVLGKLRAPLGAYYILGNHDARVGESQVRAQLDRAGLISLGGSSMCIRSSDCSVLLAGDERPWFGDGPALTTPQDPSPGLRLLLAHSPDRYTWARENGFDVMLAGHTHGGQVQLPILGPVVSPSRHGTRYASGVFSESPTVLHVSRGVSGEHPIRWRCPPEITQLTLVAHELARGDSAQHEQLSGATSLPVEPSLNQA